MTHVLALETSDGAQKTFTSPIPWDVNGPTPTINGRTEVLDYQVMSSTQVTFDEAPRIGDVVGFFVAPPVA